MTTTQSHVLVPTAPVFTNAERLALAGYLAGYSGLTREAYQLDLRQFAGWCQQHQLHLFEARRSDIEGFRPRPGSTRPRPGNDHAPAVYHRRVLQVRRRGGAAGSFPGRSCPPSAAGL
jgi:hypothetical protein